MTVLNRAAFAIVAEIDYCCWGLETMLAQEKRLTSIERMIDTASGFDHAKLRQAKKIMARIKLLKKRLGTL